MDNGWRRHIDTWRQTQTDGYREVRGSIREKERLGFFLLSPKFNKAYMFAF